jgi:hypothetical protein
MPDLHPFGGRVSRHFVRLSLPNAYALRKLVHRLGRSPLRTRKNQTELFTEMKQEFRYRYADFEFEQLAPEDAYLSCKLKQCN